MGVMAKKKIKYIGGNLPDNISDLLLNADEQDLRIMTLLLMSADANGEIPDGVSFEDILGISKSELDASLKFWQGAGAIGSTRAVKRKPEEQEPAKKISVPTAHRGGAVESGGVDNYRSAELATILERREVTASFVDEAQRVFGKTFNSYDVNIVVGLVEQYGFEEEAILVILAYVLRKGKRSVRYAEKIAISLYDDGITSAEDTVKKIAEMEASKEIISQIKKMYGFGSRALTNTEEALFTKWTRKYGYDIDAIRIAYDITVNAIQKPAPKYTDKIIEKWYSEGLRTVFEIEERENAKRADESAEKDPQKSYELDDFFSAAMNRSFNDLK